MKKEKTERGFVIMKGKDFYEQQFSIQQSSIATSNCIWLGLDYAHPMILASDAHLLGVKTKETEGWIEYPIPEEVSLKTRMHLNQEQVAELIPILQRFVDTGNLT